MCDETTNRMGQAVFLIMFRILPSSSNDQSLLIVASVEYLDNVTGDSTSKAVIKALNKYDVQFENVVAVSSDSAPYMNLSVRLLKELVNKDLIHIQCWDHKLDKVSKVFCNKLVRLNDFVKNCKKLFKNTRKRRSMYTRFLKKKYMFTRAKPVKLFPLPVMSRWGSWKTAVIYLCDYAQDIHEYAQTLKAKDVKAVKYFEKTTKEDMTIILAEATFVREYCGPVEDLMLLIEGSKYPTAHLLYPQVREVLSHFSVIVNAVDIKSVLMEDTRKSVNAIASRNKRINVLDRMGKVGADCKTMLEKFLSDETAREYFEACEALFSPRKILALKSKDSTEVAAYVTKHKEKVYLFRDIPTPNFNVMHSLLVDFVCEALKSNVKKGKDYCVVVDMVMSMKAKYYDFSIACLQALHIITSNTDVERGFSGYTDIVSHRRCSLLPGNAEIMTCMYLHQDDCDDCEFYVEETEMEMEVNGNEKEDPRIDPDDDF